MGDATDRDARPRHHHQEQEQSLGLRRALGLRRLPEGASEADADAEYAELQRVARERNLILIAVHATQGVPYGDDLFTAASECRKHQAVLLVLSLDDLGCTDATRQAALLLFGREDVEVVRADEVGG